MVFINVLILHRRVLDSFWGWYTYVSQPVLRRKEFDIVKRQILRNSCHSDIIMSHKISVGILLM